MWRTVFLVIAVGLSVVGMVQDFSSLSLWAKYWEMAKHLQGLDKLKGYMHFLIVAAPLFMYFGMFVSAGVSLVTLLFANIEDPKWGILFYKLKQYNWDGVWLISSITVLGLLVDAKILKFLGSSVQFLIYFVVWYYIFKPFIPKYEMELVEEESTE